MDGPQDTEMEMQEEGLAGQEASLGHASWLEAGSRDGTSWARKTKPFVSGFHIHSLRWCPARKASSHALSQWQFPCHTYSTEVSPISELPLPGFQEPLCFSPGWAPGLSSPHPSSSLGYRKFLAPQPTWPRVTSQLPKLVWASDIWGEGREGKNHKALSSYWSRCSVVLTSLC